MGHNHQHHGHPTSGRRLGVAFFLNLSFTLIELVGGYLTNSVAIMADAVHDLGDTGSLGLAWYLDRVSKRSGDATFTFGYKRFSLLGALVTGLILFGGSLLILSEAIPRLLEPEYAHPEGMIGLAILGVVVNGAAVLRLKSGNTLNERMVSWHLLEDVIGWVAVLIGSVIMYFFELPIVDPILSVGITIYILYHVYKNMKQVIKTFLQATPDNIDLDELKSRLQNVTNVEDIHHMHVWSQDGENHVMTTHAVAQAETPPDAWKTIREDIRKLAEDMGIRHTTVELEIGPNQCADG